MLTLDLAHIRSKYKDKMLMLAFVGSQWSGQPEGQRHGCTLALDGKYVVSIGFNGPDRTWRWPRPLPVEIVHAEVNAILNAKQIGVDLSRCVAFVTKRPCEPCMEALAIAGVRAVFWLQNCSSDDCYQVIA